jgi:hypothetical protein
MALALALVIGVELFSEAVYPVPADLQDNIPEHVRRYPDWILAVVVPVWGATAAAATGVASRIGNRPAGAVVALLLAWAIVFNLTAWPYTLWFKIVMLIVFPIACLFGITTGARRPTIHGQSNARSAG